MSLVDFIGAALVALRKRAGLSQAAVEQRAGLSGGSLSRFERGDQHPRIETLGGILEALGADLGDLGLEARKAAGKGGEAPLEADPPPDERVAVIDRVAREIGLAALAEVAERERAALMQAARDRLSSPTTGGTE